MRKQGYPVERLTGGQDVSVDALFLTDRNSPYLRNVRFDKGLIRKGLGFKKFGVESGSGLPLDGTPLLIDNFPMLNGTTHLLVSTHKWVYKYNADGTYTKKNPTSQFTGDLDNQFGSSVTLDSVGGDLYILTNGKDNIKKWDGGGGDFTDLGGWVTASIKAKQLIPYASRLIACHTIESGVACPLRCRWTVAGDPEDVTGSGSGFVDLAETVDWVVVPAILRGKLFIIKERSVWELVHVGGSDVFKPYLKLDGIGSYSPLGVISLGEEIILYGTDNVYLYDGINLIPTGEQVYPLLYETEKRIVNAAKANRVPSMYVEELKEFMMCCPTVGEIPDLLFTYNFDYRSWSLRNKQITSFGYSSVPPSPTWNDLVGAWNAQTWVWMEKGLPAGAPLTLIGTPDGYIWEDDRLTKSSDYFCWDSKDWMFAHGERMTEFKIQAKGGPFTCYYSLDQGETWPISKTFSASSTWKEYTWFINLTCQHIRMRIETYAEDMDIKWIEPWYIPRARSKQLATS